jgi:predicted metal-dependent hydrolase
LKIHNHGRDFYELLLNYSPDYRHLRRELNHVVKTIGV